MFSVRGCAGLKQSTKQDHALTYLAAAFGIRIPNSSDIFYKLVARIRNLNLE